MGIKEVFRNIEQDEFELETLQKKNEILRGHLNEAVGPLDPENPKALNAVLKKRDKDNVQLDLFLKAFQQWQESCEEKGV